MTFQKTQDLTSLFVLTLVYLRQMKSRPCLACFERVLEPVVSIALRGARLENVGLIVKL